MRPRRAFTLVELLVVAGLISVFAIVAIRSFGGRDGAALQAAQATLANLIVAARTKAAAAGQPVRLMVHVDPDSPERFLRQTALQIYGGGAWTTLGVATLPDGAYVMPGNFPLPDGLLPATAQSWTRSDGSALRSTALRSENRLVAAVAAPDSESWVALPFAAVGTTNSPGDIVLATGRRLTPGEYGAGESPVELTHAEQVRGLSVSTYGVATLIDRRTGF